MSSHSDSDSEVSEPPHHTYSLPQTSDNGNNNGMTGRNVPAMTPYLVSNDHAWAHQESLGHGAGASSSASTSSRTVTPSMLNMSAEVRRKNIMAMDRKRRLTGSNHDNGVRRRNTSGGFNDREDIAYNNRGLDGLPSSSRSPPSRPQRRRSSPRSSAEVIDLTSSPPQPTRRSPPTSSPRSSGSIYVVPRWQPDSEVNECPICRKPFTFLFRRHHCRKCGRVVCNDCSPHRITIPRQFIVNPPGPSIYGPGREAIDLTGNDDDNMTVSDSTRSEGPRHRPQFQNVGIGGGEKVRLCNPCVPDPQPDPQPNYIPALLPSPPVPGRRDDLLTLSDALRGSRREFHSTNRIEPFPGFANQHNLPYTPHPPRIRPLPLIPPVRGESESGPSQTSSYPYHNSDPSQRYRQWSDSSFNGPQSIRHRHHVSDVPRILPQPVNRPRVRSMLDESYLPRMFSGHVPPAARPRLSEEDICPVCRRALPPRGPDGNESVREAHIMDCISARDPSSQMGSSGRSMGTAALASGSVPRGPMHMLTFVATEKDCVGDDELNTPECSICMVEYDVGDELARLECLCKFHRECISEWFTRKQECPVHKIS